MKILVTGFKPFLGESINPSEKLSIYLAQKNSQVESLILPVEFSKSFDVLKEHVGRNNYKYILLLGQASGRNKISLEKIALNWLETSNKDESGYLPPMGPIDLNGPLAQMTQFPVNKIFESLKSFPLEISFTAGTYVCNDLYYRALTHLNNQTILFVHVPLIQEQSHQGAKPFMNYSDQQDILQKIINELL